MRLSVLPVVPLFVCGISKILLGCIVVYRCAAKGCRGARENRCLHGLGGKERKRKREKFVCIVHSGIERREGARAYLRPTLLVC